MYNDFTQKFLELAKKRSSFCLGIDPSKSLLETWGLTDNISGLAQMCDIILKAATNKLSVIKPQSAYFERFGPEGLHILKNLIDEFHKQNTLVILDVKRGDIGSTNLAYAESYLGTSSYYQCDAITANAYMGFDSLNLMLEHAYNTGTTVFIVVKSSNQEGRIIQTSHINNDHNITIADYLASEIVKFNKINNTNSVGAVIGATLHDIESLINKLENSLILCPGIGYQGASIKDLLTKFGEKSSLIIPTAARSVLAAGPDEENLAKIITQYCNESFALNNY